MTIPQDELAKVREALDNAAHPVFFFDDDPDGLSAYLLLYRYKREGKGVIIKSSPELAERFAAVANEYGTDLIIVLDKPVVSQEFLDAVRAPVIWIDHHEPVVRKGKSLTYLNPRLYDAEDNRPTTYWAWQIVKDERPDDIWIAGVGVVADWFIPDFRDALASRYPGLLPVSVKMPAEALYDSRIGLIARIFHFNLKGSTKDALISAKILSRVKGPDEIFGASTSQAGYILKRYKQVQREYEAILHQVKPTRKRILFFKYDAANTAFTGNLGNELLYRYPKKVILITRVNEGRYICSLRADKRYSPPVDTSLKEALEGVEGSGGGHQFACGASIAEKDFPRFLERFEKSIQAAEKKMHKTHHITQHQHHA